MVKDKIGLHIDTNAIVDDGTGLLTFTNGLVITDDTMQKNGTRYDIASMDLSEYLGQVTADHIDSVQTLIGRVINLAKRRNKVTVDGIMFAVKENPIARLAYDLMRNGYLKAVSIETYGEPPDDDGIYHNAKLIGLSTVIVGNNKSAIVNELAVNSLEQARKDGLNTDELEKLFNKFEIPLPEVINNDNAKKEDEPMADDVKDEKKPEPKAENKAPEPKVEQKQDDGSIDFNSLVEALSSKVSEAVKPIADRVEAMEKNAFDKSAKEPEFVKDNNGGPARRTGTKDEFKNMDVEERTVLQVNSAIEMITRHDYDAAQRLNAINLYHLEQLKHDGLVKNQMTISDFGNFVIAPEQLTEIQGKRTNYSTLLNATEWKETLSLQMAWLSRSGDIDMQNVEFCDDGADGNLKPISEYGAEINTSNLEELAAVTPVCNAATRFLAADLLGDVQAGYRNDYDRKRAQLVIARLEQAVEDSGNSDVYNVTSPTEGLTQPLGLWSMLADTTPTGTFVMNSSTFAYFVGLAVTAGVSGPLGSMFTTGDLPTLYGRPMIVVPNDLMPTINTSETKTFVVDGENVVVNHAVFYTDMSNFTGRVSGGLQYDIATQAAYEVGGQVKSAFQRNEIVLRGSFFRGGAIKDPDQVAGLQSAGVS